MNKKINKSEYNIRTIAFYLQSPDHIYHSIISVLVRMRSEPQFRGMRNATVILNNASYQCAIKSLDGCDNLTLCVMACLSSSDKDFLNKILDSLKNDTVYYPRFECLIGKSETYRETPKTESSDQTLSKELAEKDDIINRQNKVLVEQNKTIYHLRAEKKEIQKQCAVAEQSHYEGSRFDRLLTLDTILKWIEGRQHYQYTEQVFRMLADLKDCVATDEERKKIKDLEDKMLDKNQTPSIFNQNFALNSNMMTGVVNDPQLPIGMLPTDMRKQCLQYLNTLNNGEGEK